MERGLVRLPGVRRAETDLNTGTVRLWLEPGATPDPKTLWDTAKKSGFTPDTVTIQNHRYKGP